jgi:hypothetical protein
MAAIGRKGYMVTCARWFHGDEGEMNAWLHKRAAEAQIHRLAAEKLAGGEETYIEGPVILDPDDDPTFEETPRQWVERVFTRRPADARGR